MFRRLWEYWVKGNWNVVLYGKTGKVTCKGGGTGGTRKTRKRMIFWKLLRTLEISGVGYAIYRGGFMRMLPRYARLGAFTGGKR